MSSKKLIVGQSYWALISKRLVNVRPTFRLVTSLVIALPGLNSGVRAEAGLLASASAPSSFAALSHLLDAALQHHPSVRSSLFERQAAESDVEVARRQRLASLSVISESNTGSSAPTTSSFPTRMARLEQTLFDWGRGGAKVEEAQALLSVSDARVCSARRSLALQVVNAWQMLLYSNSRVKASLQTNQLLDRYREQIQRRVEGDLSPAIDLELVQSRILQTRVEHNAAMTSARIALLKLHQLTGLASLQNMPVESANLGQRELDTEADLNRIAAIDWQEVLSSDPAVSRASHDLVAVLKRLDAKKAERYPQFYARLDQPLGGTNTGSYLFVGVRVTPGAGLSNFAEEQVLGSRISSAEEAIETAKKEALEAVDTDLEELRASGQRIEALQAALKGAENVLESYSRQFTAGKRSWLEVMNSVREVAQSQYALGDVRAASAGAAKRLLVRGGLLAGC